MAIKIVQLGNPARAGLLRGANVLADAVVVTLGPRGRTVLLYENYGPPTVTKDGVTVAKRIDLGDAFENMGVEILREAALKASERAGDGTTTAIVLARELVREAVRLISAGHDPIDVRRGIETGVKEALRRLQKISRLPRSKDDLVRIAMVSANGDEEIARMVADAVDEVGPEGVVAVEEARGVETKLEVVKGMDFDRGLLSGSFATDKLRRIAQLEDCLILLSAKKLSAAMEILPVVEYAVNEGKTLVVIAEDVSGEALSLLIQNNVRGVLRCAAVKAPGAPSARRELLEDIAVVTDGTVFSEELGIRLEDATAHHLGHADRVRIDIHNTTISGGAGTEAEVAKRARMLRRRIEAEAEDFQREQLEGRLAKLVGGVAILRIGGATEVDMKERQTRAENAAEATKAALLEGIVPGGGVALLRASAGLDSLDAPEAQQPGIRAVGRALAGPLFWIARNAAANAPVVVDEVRTARKRTLGFNALTGQVEDMFAAGVIDPTKVVRIALESAASAANVLLMTETAVIDHPNPPEKTYLDPPVPERWK